MEVVNTFGADISFDKFGTVYRIPNDGNRHYLPDEFVGEDCGQLYRIVEYPKPKVTIAEIKMDELKIDEVPKVKPLHGIKLTSTVRAGFKKKSKAKWLKKIEEGKDDNQQ